MEHQAAQHQQYVTLEGIENSNARALVVKAINVLLTLLQVIIVVFTNLSVSNIFYHEGIVTCFGDCRPDSQTFPKNSRKSSYHGKRSKFKT